MTEELAIIISFLKYIGLLVGGFSSIYAAWTKARRVENQQIHLDRSLRLSIVGFMVGLLAAVIQEVHSNQESRDARDRIEAQSRQIQDLERLVDSRTETITDTQSRILTRFDEIKLLATVQIPWSEQEFGEYYHYIEGIIEEHLIESELGEEFEKITVSGTGSEHASVFRIQVDSPHYFPQPKFGPFRECFEQSIVGLDVFETAPAAYSRFTAAAFGLGDQGFSLIQMLATGTIDNPDLRAIFTRFTTREMEVNKTLGYVDIALDAKAEKEDIYSSSKIISRSDLIGKEFYVYLEPCRDRQRPLSQEAGISYLTLIFDSESFRFKRASEYELSEVQDDLRRFLMGDESFSTMYPIQEAVHDLKALRGVFPAE